MIKMNKKNKYLLIGILIFILSTTTFVLVKSQSLACCQITSTAQDICVSTPVNFRRVSKSALPWVFAPTGSRDEWLSFTGNFPAGVTSTTIGCCYDLDCFSGTCVSGTCVSSGECETWRDCDQPFDCSCLVTCEFNTCCCADFTGEGSCPPTCF